MNIVTMKEIHNTEAYKNFTAKYNDLYRTKEIIDKIISDGPILDVMPYPDNLMVLKSAAIRIQGNGFPICINIVGTITGLTALAGPLNKVAEKIIQKGWERYLSSMGCDKDFIKYFNENFNMGMQTPDVLIPILKNIGIKGTDKFTLALNRYEWFHDQAVLNAEQYNIKDLKDQMELDKHIVYMSSMAYKLN